MKNLAFTVVYFLLPGCHISGTQNPTIENIKFKII